jgi:hypothetical protein
MDLSQSKLSKSEWETIEVPVSDAEKKILKMIIQGYDNINIRINETQSLYSYVKIEPSDEIDYYLYKKYFDPIVSTIIKKYNNTPLKDYTITGSALKTMKSATSVRLQILENNIETNKSNIFEFLLLELFGELVKQIHKGRKKYAYYLYTILQLKQSSIPNINSHVLHVVDVILAHANSLTKTSEIITNAYEFIEKNPYLLKYQDKTLFSHQKDLFTICKPSTPGDPFQPKLILYTAPTGTGKTLSPIALAGSYRIIFVCVARHIGLALAKASISMEKKVAFAFGCETASDIRLHYFAAVDYTRNRRTGGIWKVDNSVGTDVEIMICDVQSYTTAMHYMLAFNSAEKIITYWDEPTITMDYDEHPLHAIIQKNWQQNLIPTVVLSCATLPSNDELRPVFDDFRNKFDNAIIHNITSYDCVKSIPILNKDGYCVLPHYLYSDYRDMITCVDYCKQNKTLLRYFDLREIVRFIEYINQNENVDESYSIDAYFSDSITDITMNKLKLYYLDALLHIDPDEWDTIHKYLLTTRQKRFNQVRTNVHLHKVQSLDAPPTPPAAGKNIVRMNSIAALPPPAAATTSNASAGISITTEDAYTLTDGPTIYLADDVNKIGAFCIKQSNIAPSVFQIILAKITNNAKLIDQIEKLERLIVAKEEKPDNSAGGENVSRKSSKGSDRLCKESKQWMDEINKLRKEIKSVSLDAIYLPNTKPHQQLWTPTGEIYSNAFVSNIGDDMSKVIMSLNVENHLKVLLLLGIGMFTENVDIRYMEIMKQLADEQRLFIIIASTDYIYGTNYQFCHGFIGKDLTHMTQQKTLQAMGRIGRNHIQQDYTIRFRDDVMIESLLKKSTVNKEAMHMCQLFCSE